MRALPAGFGPNLLRRLLTAAVALPLLFLAFFRGPLALGVGIVAVALLVGLFEFFRMLAARELRPMRLSGLLLAMALFLDVAFPHWHRQPVWPLLALVLLGVTLLPGRRLTETIPAAAGTVLAALYLGGLGGTIGGLLVAPPAGLGAWRLLFLLGTIMASDTLAFFVGHAIGRHRLAPAVSPGKTIEGALAGVVGGVLSALAVRHFGFPEMPEAHAALLGAAIAALGIVGDLDESLLKRWAGVKDSGTLFPGHGGMLDRIDSLLFGAPVLYFYFLQDGSVFR